jgi:hypothetical protein
MDGTVSRRGWHDLSPTPQDQTGRFQLRHGRKVKTTSFELQTAAVKREAGLAR